MREKSHKKFRRMPLVCKYRWRGMAKTNFRRHNKRGKTWRDVAEYVLESRKDIWKELANE